MDIIVTMPKGDLNHLQMKIDNLNSGKTEWWDTKRRMILLTDSSKVFVVCAGNIKGYFTIKNFNFDQLPDGWIEFSNWVSIKEVSMNGFPGFKYRRSNYYFDFEELN
jgi:hypothetical protein